MGAESASEHAEAAPVEAVAGAVDRGATALPPSVSGGRLTPAGALALQAAVGNRLTRRVVASAAPSLRLQRKPPPTPAEVAAGAAKRNAPVATALSKLPAGDIRTRLEAMSTEDRRGVVSAARDSEPAAWVDTIVSTMMEVDKRSAILGSLEWAHRTHRWPRASGWFHGLSLEDGRAVAKELDYTNDQISQFMGASEYLKQMFPGVKPAHFETTWPTTDGGASASADEQAALKALVTARKALPVRAEFTKKRGYGDKPETGYQWAAAGVGTIPAETDRLTRLALQEFHMLEAGVSAVVTYDGTLSLGAGFADVMAAAWVRTWFDADPAAERKFEAAGMSVGPGGEWIVVNDADPPAVVRGEPARQFIRESPQLLSLFADVAASPDHLAKASDAQTSRISDGINRIPADLRKEFASWDDGLVAATLHLMWWLPAGGPTGSPNRFRGASNNAFAVAKGFASGLAGTRDSNLWHAGPRPTSARVIGATKMTAGIITHYFQRFGGGAGPGNGGILRRAVAANASLINKSVDGAMDDASLDDHVLLVASGDTGAPPSRDATVPMYDLGKWR